MAGMLDTALKMKYGVAAGLVGAGIGALANPDDRGTGSAVGAALGVAGATGIRAYQNHTARPWMTKAFMKTPMKGYGALALAGAATVGYGAIMGENPIQTSSTANEDGSITENYNNYQYSLSDRIASMNVSGDLVFGLHNKRHG